MSEIMPTLRSLVVLASAAAGLAAIFCGGADAKLVPLSLEDFRAQSTCALVVEVHSTGEREEPRRVGPGEVLDATATVKVIEVVGHIDREADCQAMASPGQVLTFWFSTELHSSQPQRNETAAIFPAKRNGVLTEAVYGRSYWRLLEWESVWDVEKAKWNRVWNVEVTWRNSFLLEPVTISSGQRALIPLEAALRSWRRTATDVT